MGRQLSIIVVPHDEGHTRNFRLSYRLLYVFGAVLVIGLVAQVAFMVTYGHILLAAERATVLGIENRRLRNQVAQIDSLKIELLRAQALAVQIKQMLGVDLSREDSLLVASWSPTASSPAPFVDEGEAVDAPEQRNMLAALPALWPVKGYVTRGFYVTGGENSTRYHPGIDIAADKDTPVVAAADGVVDAAGWDETYGWMVRIDHGYGIHTLYGHNARNLVKVGDRVTRGQTIALLGSTGKSTAPHLHFEVRRNGVPVNPRDYLLR